MYLSHMKYLDEKFFFMFCVNPLSARVYDYIRTPSHLRQIGRASALDCVSEQAFHQRNVNASAHFRACVYGRIACERIWRHVNARDEKTILSFAAVFYHSEWLGATARHGGGNATSVGTKFVQCAIKVDRVVRRSARYQRHPLRWIELLRQEASDSRIARLPQQAFHSSNFRGSLTKRSLLIL